MCGGTLLYARHDLFIPVTWLIHVCDWGKLHLCVHTRDIIYSYVWHYSFICVIWLIHMCNRTHPYTRHNLFVRVTWDIHICDMTHSHASGTWEWMSHVAHANESCRTCEWVMSRIWMSNVTHMNQTCFTRICTRTRKHTRKHTYTNTHVIRGIHLCVKTYSYTHLYSCHMLTCHDTRMNE